MSTKTALKRASGFAGVMSPATDAIVIDRRSVEYGDHF